MDLHFILHKSLLILKSHQLFFFWCSFSLWLLQANNKISFTYLIGLLQSWELHTCVRLRISLRWLYFLKFWVLKVGSNFLTEKAKVKTLESTNSWPEYNHLSNNFLIVAYILRKYAILTMRRKNTYDLKYLCWSTM